MTMMVLVYLYLTVALMVSGYVYWRGIVERPVAKEMETEHRAVLSIAAVAVGLFWVLFTPALLALWSVRSVRYVEARIPRISLRSARQARARS